MAEKKDKGQSTFDNEELDRQLERLGFFSHTSLSKHANRINTLEEVLTALVNELSNRQFIDQHSINREAKIVKKEIQARQGQLFAGVAIRKDTEEYINSQSPEVNCEERIHICKAACCKLSYALSKEEIESGKIKWDLGIPYYIRQNKHGECTHLDSAKKCCTIYDDRPFVCKKYSCKNDGRIWKDFDNMILNQEWVDTKLVAQEVNVVNINLVPKMK